MPRSINEIADLLDDAHEGMMIAAKAIAGPDNEGRAGVVFTTKDGATSFNLAELAADLRANA